MIRLPKFYIALLLICLVNVIFSIEPALTEEDSSPTPATESIVDAIKILKRLPNNHIANENLKVWKAVRSAGVHSLEISDDQNLAGKWTMYQDRSSNSAMVLFSKTNQWVGIFNGTAHHQNVDSILFKKISDGEEVSTTTTPSTSTTTSSTASPTTSPRTTKLSPIFYLEALIFINGEVYSNSWDANDYTMHALALVNYLDMLLSKTRFKINIAGLVYKEQKQSLPFLHTSSSNPLMVLDTKEKIENFLDTQKDKLPTDSYDFILYFNSMNLVDDTTLENITDILFYPKDGIYNCSRTSPKKSHPVILASSQMNHTSMAKAAHQILHMIGAPNYIKELNESNSSNSTNCTAMAIKDFDEKPSFKWTEDYCVFVNKPRSLHSASSKVILLNEDEHCWCHNYNYYYDKNMTLSHNDTDAICTKGFTCALNKKPVFNVTSVMKGTACGENKVCWDNKCVTADSK